MQYCAISGEQCRNGVVSIKSGHIFEKELIEKYIDTVGICPITNQELSRKDLVEIKCNEISKPKINNNLNMN